MLKQKSPSGNADQPDQTIRDFAEFVEKQANLMERSGWLREAAGFRRWAANLRRDSTASQEGVNGVLWTSG